MVKNPLANAGDVRDEGSILGLEGSPEGHGNPLQYSHLENPMDRRAWRAIVHRITKSWTQLKRPSMHAQLCERTFTTCWVGISLTLRYEREKLGV